jgi:carboxymethylenebutenolidase
VADGYAADGYFAIAPAMFHRFKHGVELGYTPDDMQAGMALKAAIEALPDMAFMADVQAAVKYAHQTSGAKVGIVGYCWGGLLTWRAAALVQGLSAAVPYYGGGSTTSEEMARHPNCPVMAHYAKQDHWIGLDTVETFSKAHPEVAVHLYEADHGFNCDHRGSYQKVSADLARERTLAFFEEHLA